MRAKFVVDSQGCVILSYDDECYDGVTRVQRTFCCPVNGGYIVEVINGQRKQVCDRLSHMGSTLSCDRAQLLSVIRREYMAMRRKEKRNSLYLL